jgi:hypothetical protein
VKDGDLDLFVLLVSFLILRLAIKNGVSLKKAVNGYSQSA